MLRLDSADANIPPAGPESVVYQGAAKIPPALAPNAVVNVQTRLTPAGAALARRLGATRLAAALKLSGYIFFTSSGGLARDGGPEEMIEVPMSNCYRNVQEAPRHPAPRRARISRGSRDRLHGLHRARRRVRQHDLQARWAARALADVLALPDRAGAS
jgi:hypothetical protein